MQPKSRLSFKTHKPEFDLPIKIVHFGIGAFARCHLLHYMDLLGAEGWGVMGVSLRSPDQKALLEPQDYLYSVLEQSEYGQSIGVISALKGIIVANDEPQKLLKILALASTEIVSLTITEKGYTQNAPAIHFLVEGLKLRFDVALPPFTVLCCDNLTQNGKRVRALVLDLAQEHGAEFVAWIETHGAFPCTMVDRIVPAQTLEVVKKASKMLGLEDKAALTHERFSQWVIEDWFAGARPPFEKLGVEIVENVAPYEAMKLKMLNGAHSAIAYLGQIEGLETVYDVMNILEHRYYIDDLWAEIIPCVEGFTAKDLNDYTVTLQSRFLNPYLHHKTAQIAMDGSQKLPPRLLNTIVARRAKGLLSPALNRAIALWAYYVLNFEINDPLSASLKRAKNLRELISIEAIFPKELCEDETWINELELITLNLSERHHHTA